MAILILTGPPTLGKNSVAPLIARQRTRCAIIDVDQVRWMLVQPHTAPWEGEEGIRQCRLGVENACLLASRFADGNCDVILLDFVWEYTIGIYRQQLARFKPTVVLLMPNLPEILHRNLVRGWLPAHEVEMLYAHMETFEEYDTKIDNSDLNPEGLAAVLIPIMDGQPSA